MEYIRIIFTDEDIASIAEATGVPLDVAQERAVDWGKHIESTATGICSEQLASCIVNNQP